MFTVSEGGVFSGELIFLISSDFISRVSVLLSDVWEADVSLSRAVSVCLIGLLLVENAK